MKIAGRAPIAASSGRLADAAVAHAGLEVMLAADFGDIGSRLVLEGKTSATSTNVAPVRPPRSL
jgi:hypothetical protein